LADRFDIRITSVPETPLTKGCQTRRWIGAIKLVVSLLLFAFFLLYVAIYSDEEISHEASRLGYAGV
jgi:hypothetical protein